MAKKTTVQITKDNIEQLDIKVGTILKDNEGIFWKITDISDFMPGMRVCDKDGKELKNFARNAKRTMIGGGLSDLLNDGITTYYIETEQPELKEEDVKNLKIVSDEISPSEIETERLLIQKKIQEIKNELENPNINYPDYKNEISDLKEYIERLEKITDDEIKNQIIWKKENQRKNEETHKLVVEDMKKGREMRNSPKEGELLSYNQIHPIFTLTNKETGRKISIQPTGRIEENIKRLGRLKNLTEAKNAIEKIKASGFDIYSTENRVVLFNKDKFYDFNDSGESNFNFQTEKFEFNIDNRNLKSWDFKSYIEGGLKITKRMKAFEKIENETAIQENELNESVFANEEEAQAIYFNDLSTEQKEEVINGYRSADDPNMLTEWENLLRENFVQIQKDNSFISSVDIEKETSVFINPPTDEWISEYLQKNKVNFNTEFWQDIFAEIEAKPDVDSVKKNIETSQPLEKIKLVSEEEQLKDYGITAEAHAKYFVKSTAEFEQFADFEPITNLTGEEAVAKYKVLQEKGVHCGIGINIEGDYVFDDKHGNGITVLVRNDEGKDTLNIYGDSFVKNLKESDQHSFDVLVAFDTLYRTAKSAGLDVEDSPYIAEKENELFENLFSQNQIYDGYASKQATNFVLEKLKTAGIEVVTDKDEFNRILKSADRLQKMTEDLSEYEKLFEKANKEKQKTESISSEKKSLEEEREVLERKNYEEFVDFVKSTEKYWSGDAVRLLNNDLCTADITDKYFNSISIAFDSKKSIMSAYYIKIDDYESLKKERLHYGFSFNDSSLLDSYKKNLKTYLEQKITIEQQNQNRMLGEIGQLKTELEKNSVDADSLASDFKKLDKSLRFNSNFEIESTKLGENVSVFPGSIGKSGLGIRHIIEERFKKDNLSQDEITALSGLVLDSVRNGDITRESDYQAEFTKNGIVAIVRKNFYGEKENWLLTGFAFDESDLNKNREATEAIKTVIAKYSNSDGYSYFRSQVGAVIASLDSNISQNQDKSTIQKMVVSSEEPENIESLFVSKNEENLNSEIDKLTEKDINVWNDYINISSEIPFIYKQFGLDNYPVNMYKQKLARALFIEKEKFGERRTHGHKGEFTSENVKDVFKDFGNPRYIFNSKHDLDNPDNFYLIGVYDELDEQGNPMMLSLHFDKNRKQVEANWVTSVYGKNKEVLLNDWVRKGYLVYKNDLEIEKASEEVVALYMRVSNLQKSSENNIKLKSDYVNDMDLLFAKQKENVYGFAHEGKIYLNPDFLNSNVAVHEYTHLWDEYTRRTNPELWQKGMNIFKDTKFFAEVKSDPNYADIANDDNLVLSEVHARICGEMAEKILERIAKEDGEITRDKAIDWNDEVFEYVYDEFGFGRNSAFAKENGKSNGYVWSDYADFLVTPLKDLMNGKNISLRQNTEQKVELQSKTIDHKSREQKKSEKLFINEYEKEEKQSMKNSNDILRSVEQLEIMEINVLNENGWRSANDIVSSNDNARKYLEEIRNRTATNLKLGKEEFSILEGDNYHTLNDALGILGVYGKEYQKDVLKKLEKYPSTILLPPDVAKEFVNDLILKTNQITPVSLEEILSVMEMKSEVTSNGKIKIYDQQRQEYIDNRSPLSDSDEDNLSFDNPAEIFERLDTYINDYFITDMEEQLQASGVTLRGDETLKDLCDYAKEQLEAGITTVSQGELNLAMGIINPETVIMPEGFDENKIPFFEKENIPKTVLEQLPKSSSELTADDLKNAKALLPKAQYQVVLEYTQGEEGEHFKGIIKEISSKAEAIKGKKEIFTKDEKHPLAFKYMLGTSSFYFSEWDGADELFGYTILNGDTQMSEWGYTSLEELKNAGGKDRNGFPVMPEMIFYGLEDTIERQIAVDYPELSEKMGFAPKLNHNEELISEFGKEIFKTLQSHKLEQNSYNICCAAQFIIQTMDSSEKKEIFSIMEKCGCKGKNGKANTENFLTEVVKAENNTASSVYDRKRLYEKINKSCSSKKTEKNEVIHNTENDYNMEI